MSGIQPQGNAINHVSEIANWLRLFVRPGQVTEIRALDVCMQYGPRKTMSGFYDHDHIDDMAKAAQRLTMSARGVYFIPNPLNPDLLARRNNRVDVADKDSLATDKDVLHRQWLLIDCDPVRLAGISATDDEKAKAKEVSERVQSHFRDTGWPEPILADSGNGFHLLYHIDLPNDDKSRDGLRRTLHALGDQFDTDAVKIDPSVFNAGRIVKLYGTMSKKGDNVPTRPHRRSKVLSVPGIPGDLN